MQSTEFNKLMDGKDANWADLFKEKRTGLLRALENGDIHTAEKRKLIEQEQEPIPPSIQSEINRFINKMRGEGMKERTIRRLVKKKWKIKVI